MLKLTKEQLTSGLSELLTKESGLTEVLELVLNGLMLAERSAFLSTACSPGNKANGYRGVKALGHGKELELSIPRDRLGVFKPVIRAIYSQEQERIEGLCFDLYGRGLTTREVGKVIENFYGKHYSPSRISQINQLFYEQMELWRNRSLDRGYPILYIDAIHVKVRRDVVSSEAFYVIMGVKEDGSREVLSIENFPSESAQGWGEVLQGLKARGAQSVQLVVSDALQGLDQAIHQHFPQARLQKCVLHLKRNMGKHIRPADRQAFHQQLKEVFQPGNQTDEPESAYQRLVSFISFWGALYPSLKKNYLHRDVMEYYFTYLAYDYRIQKMIYTTNWIERLNKSFKRTIKIRNALPSVEAAMTLLTHVAMEKTQTTYSRRLTTLFYDQSLFYEQKK